MQRTLANGLLSVVLVSLCLADSACFAQGGTFFNFLGIPKGVNKVRDAFSNRRGNHPGMERTPARKGIADPKFLEPEIAPGIETPKPLQAAAKVKTLEDLAPQKIKAVKYLAKIGCGCYNDKGEITEAMLDALGDCTEDVRMATVKAIGQAARGEACEKCKNKSCCNIDILTKLADMAYKRDEFGCYLEPSERIREEAIKAMQACCSGQGPIEYAEPGSGPEGSEPEGGGPESGDQPEGNSAAEGDGVARQSSRRKYRLANATLERKTRATPQRREPVDVVKPVFPKSAVVGWVDLQQQTAQVIYHSKGRVPNGVRVAVQHKYLLGSAIVGQFEIVQQTKNGVVIRPLGRSKITDIARGDDVRFKR